jgi:hypothetical protein
MRVAHSRSVARATATTPTKLPLRYKRPARWPQCLPGLGGLPVCQSTVPPAELTMTATPPTSCPHPAVTVPRSPPRPEGIPLPSTHPPPTQPHRNKRARGQVE